MAAWTDIRICKFRAFRLIITNVLEEACGVHVYHDPQIHAAGLCLMLLLLLMMMVMGLEEQ